MHNDRRSPNLIFGATLRTEIAGLGTALAFVLFLLLLFMILSAQLAKGQTFEVIYSFTGGADGASPAALTLDAAGNLYGTAAYGGNTGSDCGSDGCGTVFRLAHKNTGWIFTPLYKFSGPDGSRPWAEVTFGPDGTLYGTTTLGGHSECVSPGGCGTVYRLRPPATVCKTALCPWSESVLHSFHGAPSDGRNTRAGVVFDHTGTLYGSTEMGGSGPCNPTGYGFQGCGVVYRLIPTQVGWTENVLYSFRGGGNYDGEAPLAGVSIDAYGDLFGSTDIGGNGWPGCGTIFRLSNSGLSWTETILHVFNCPSEGDGLFAGLTLDELGNLYGAASHDGPNGGGTVFELSPGYPDWTFRILYAFAGSFGSWGPTHALQMDGSGNLYGASNWGGIGGCDYNECGFIFKLTPSGTLTHLYDFTGADDGTAPQAVTLDSHGNLWGTASGGVYGKGVIFKITP